jgi:hypothetical protein
MQSGPKTFFLDFRYKDYVDSQGGTIDMRGARAINDGGYREWLHTIAGSKEGTATTDDEARWGSAMESMRKDSERCFGEEASSYFACEIQPSKGEEH